MSYVLIVDDDHTMAQTLSDMVGLFDWSTQIVTSPRAAIESLQRNAPALILLDLNMPGVDGLEVCRYIKRDPVAGQTPVVFVTAEDDLSTKDRATAAGAMDYLVKPVDIDQLEQILEKLPSRPGIVQLSSEKPPDTKAAEQAPQTRDTVHGTPIVSVPIQPSTPLVPPSAPSSAQPVDTPAKPASAPQPEKPAESKPS